MNGTEIENRLRKLATKFQCNELNIIADEIKYGADVTCDICGGSCRPQGSPWENGPQFSPEFATLKSCWGYGSNKDTQEHRCNICESCYDKVRDFIEKDLKGKIKVTSYTPFRSL